MITPERPDAKQTGRIKKSSFLPIFLVSLVLAAGITVAWLLFIPPTPSLKIANQQPTPQASAAQPSSPPKSPSPTPVQLLTSLPVIPPATPTVQIEEKRKGSVDGIPPEPSDPAPGAPVLNEVSTRQLQCKQLANRLHDFFNHLDKKEYIQDVQLGVTAQEYFLALTTKLLNTPPVVSRESDDLYTILKNMAHFFRVIGGNNIVIIKGILDRERDTIEDVAADLFLWTTAEKCSDNTFTFQAPMDKLYEYAGFFLNSMGGRSYLFRRDSRSRLLVNYYALLLIDRANMEGINQHGIDIKPLLPITINEIEGSNQLIYKEKYLDSLYGLIEKYQ